MCLKTILYPIQYIYPQLWNLSNSDHYKKGGAESFPLYSLNLNYKNHFFQPIKITPSFVECVAGSPSGIQSIFQSLMRLYSKSNVTDEIK